MEPTGRATATDVALAPLIQKARRYEFFQLVELLHRHHEDDQEQRHSEGVPSFQRVRYKASSSLGFPGSDVLALGVGEREIGRAHV